MSTPVSRSSSDDPFQFGATPAGAAGPADTGLNARRLLGDVKCRVVDRWPYALLKPYAQWRRDRCRPRIETLPAVSAAEDAGEIEIHMLCGLAQADMGIWASWSIMRFLPNALLYVHSDGTLTADDFQQWQSIVPSSILITSAETDERFMTELGRDLPALARWRDGYWSARQVIDFHLFGRASAFVGMDSDVLCFEPPREVEECMRQDRPAFRWTRDLRDYYSADRRLLESVTGLAIPPGLNCGFLVCPRFTRDDFEVMDRTLRALDRASIDVFHWAMGQTLYAICAAHDERSAPLPPAYDVRVGKLPRDVVTRHYVSLWNVRPKYFIEGVPRLLKDLDATARQASNTSTRRSTPAEADATTVR